MDSLKDGMLLCKLVNKILPGSAKYKESKMPFKQMENIAAFLDAAQKKLGMPTQDLFQTIDLYEKKNPVQVIDSIHSFSRFAARAGWEGPILGPKLADKVERQFTDQQLNAGKGMVNKVTFNMGMLEAHHRVDRACPLAVEETSRILDPHLHPAHREAVHHPHDNPAGLEVSRRHHHQCKFCLVPQHATLQFWLDDCIWKIETFYYSFFS